MQDRRRITRTGPQPRAREEAEARAEEAAAETPKAEEVPEVKAPEPVTEKKVTGLPVSSMTSDQIFTIADEIDGDLYKIKEIQPDCVVIDKLEHSPSGGFREAWQRLVSPDTLVKPT